MPDRARPGLPEAVGDALRLRAEAQRQDAVARFRRRQDPMASAVAEDLSRDLIDALLAPVIAALDPAQGTDRQHELALAARDLFALNDVRPRSGEDVTNREVGTRRSPHGHSQMTNQSRSEP